MDNEEKEIIMHDRCDECGRDIIWTEPGDVKCECGAEFCWYPEWDEEYRGALLPSKAPKHPPNHPTLGI